jgi:gliding motility-associated-like protein
MRLFSKILLPIFCALALTSASAQQLLSTHDTLVCSNSFISRTAQLEQVDSVKINTFHFDVSANSLSWPALPIGFNFAFFGRSYSLFRPGMDNIICLYDPPYTGNGQTGAHPWSNMSIGINLNLKNAILLGFQDLNIDIIPDDVTKVRYQKIGPPGSRKLVVDYCQMKQNSYAGGGVSQACSTNMVTNQVILYEGSNIIEFHTKNMPASLVCPPSSAGPDNAVQGLYYYDPNNVAHQVYTPGRGPGDNWGAVGGQYTARRFTPIPNPPYYQVDTIPYNPWHIIGHVEFTSYTPPYSYIVHTIDTHAFYWYDAQGTFVSQGATLNAAAAAPPGQNHTFFVVKYLGSAGCDTVSNLSDTFWVHFAEDSTIIDTTVCAGLPFSFLGNVYTQPGTYDTVLSNRLGCDSLVRLQLHWEQLPALSIQGPKPARLCEDSSYTLAASGMQGYLYQWYYNGVPINGAATAAIQITQPGWYSFSLASPNGCMQLMDSIEVILQPAPSVSLEADKTSFCAGDTLSLRAGAPDAVLFSWLPENLFIGNPQGADAQAIVINSDILSVRVSDAFGCKGADSIRIHTYPCCEIRLPTAFTPNNDGKNDVFRPILGPGRSVLEMKVYSRWGNIVYQCYSNNCDVWTGRDYLGRICDAGVYMYYLKYKCADGKEYFTKGEITLAR